MTPISLVRDVLDQQLVARDGVRIGKVDDIVLTVRGEGPPELAGIECGGIAPARRLEWPLRGLLIWMSRRWGVRHGEPFRIPWHLVRDIGPDVDVDIAHEDTPAWTWERRVLDHVIGRIPGA